MRVSPFITALFIVELFLLAKVQASSNCPEGVKFISDPENVTLNVGDRDVRLTCTVTEISFIGQNAIKWLHSLNGVDLERVQDTFKDDPNNLFEYDASSGDLIIREVTQRHHGEYICSLQNPCDAVFSATGYINVRAPILIEFVNDEPEPTYDLDSTHKISLNMFGYPVPQLTLYQKHSSSKRAIDGYSVVNRSSVSASVTGVTFKSVHFEDEGSYILVAENTNGTSNISFNVKVKGVEDPLVTLSESTFEPTSYGDNALTVVCSVPKNSHDYDSGPLTIDWYHEQSGVINKVATLSTADVFQTTFNETRIMLNIQRVVESDNGNYVCIADNDHVNAPRNDTFTIRGPPGAISNLRTISAVTAIIWDKPELYGSQLDRYEIRYTNGDTTREHQLSSDEKEVSFSIPADLCPNGQWDILVWAVNEHGGVGPTSSIQVTIPDSNCNSNSVDNPSITSTSTSSNDRMPTTRTSTTTSTVRIPSTNDPSSETATGNQSSSLPIAVGAAAGAFVLIILVAVLVLAIVCYIGVSRRGSKPDRAEQQWGQHVYRDTDQMDNGYVETNSMPTKSPDPQLNSYEMGMPSPLPITQGYSPIYIDPRYEFPRENLDFTDILYDGAFTVIYKAKAVGITENKPIDVAVKSLKEEYLDFDDYSSALIMEMEQLAQLEPHPNIVGLVRVCTVSKPVLMVMEYMCHGDLLGFLRTTRGHTDMYTVNPGMKNLPTGLKLTSRDLLSIIRQVATGMQFLSEQKIVHGALCARNILVSSNMEVKIFNIGIHNLDNDETLESLVRWVAPEVFVDGVRTSYGDVWSFGVLMWEVVTLGGTPYAESGTDDLYTQLMSGVRLQKPPHCTQPVYDVMSTCWETIPQHRPLFFEINDHLQNLNLSKMSYLDLRNYNDTAYSQFDESERQQTSIL